VFEALLRRLAFSFAVTVVSVVGRAAITQPIQGDVELTQFGIALAISLGLPWCQLRSANIIVDFFTQRASRRTQGLLDGIGCVLLAVMCALLAWRTGVGAFSVHQAHEQSMILELPMWWAYASLAPGLVLTSLIALWQAAGHFSGRLRPIEGEAAAVAAAPGDRA
jgi:TRAP-type C4-dicarboxylate transport system permease small subunit